MVIMHVIMLMYVTSCMMPSWPSYTVPLVKIEFTIFTYELTRTVTPASDSSDGRKLGYERFFGVRRYGCHKSDRGSRHFAMMDPSSLGNVRLAIAGKR